MVLKPVPVDQVYYCGVQLERKYRVVPCDPLCHTDDQGDPQSVWRRMVVKFTQDLKQKPVES